MNKTQLIIQREYLSRVRKKSFLLTTLLLPVLFLGLMVGVGVLAAKSDSEIKVAVIDETNGTFAKALESKRNVRFEWITSGQFSDWKTKYEQEGYDALLRIDAPVAGHPLNATIYSENQIGMNKQEFIENQLEQHVKANRFQSAGISQALLDSLDKNLVHVTTLVGKEEKSSSSAVAYGIGYAAGILIYFVMLLYGSGVMRGVMEEKTNRIAEIIISSVKPFQLMMGKIVGIALVGLTQFVIWMVLMGIIRIGVMQAFPDLFAIAQPTAANAAALSKSNEMASVMQMLGSQNWTLIISCFLFFFLGGYFLYASLFAAVGSLVNEDPQDAQQLSIPITLPIILSFVIMSAAVNNPNGKLAVFGSLFPLTSPIVMMARIPFGVPAWQLILSILLLIGGFIFTTWMAAKIYRIGILMYGKKVTLKEVGKWLMTKN